MIAIHTINCTKQMNGGKNKTQNRLWLNRKRKGLKQKQVAYLLNHRNTDQISRYENGLRMPTLRAALKLEIILGVPVSLLFPDLYEQLRREIRERATSSKPLAALVADVIDSGRCFYEELLSSSDRSAQDLENIRRHAKDLVNKISLCSEPSKQS